MSTFELWEPLQPRPEFTSIIITVIFLTAVFIVYYVKLRKIPANVAPTGFVLLMQIYIEYIRMLVIDILGKRQEKLTPYFLFLFSYLVVCNLIGIFGLPNPTGSLTVTLSLGLIMFFGTFVIGFRYQKLSYLTRFFVCVKNKKTGKKYPIVIAPNPLNFIDVIAPLISISFRIWGNIFAGSIIVTLWYFLFGWLQSFIPVIGVLNLLGGLTAPPIHAYFDIMVGIIQALVFTMLTMVYWTLAKENGNYEVNDNVEPKPNNYNVAISN